MFCLCILHLPRLSASAPVKPGHSLFCPHHCVFSKDRRWLVSFLTSLPWHLEFLCAEQRCKASLTLKISEPHKHEKASSWMEGASPAEPVPWMWSFGVHGCQFRCPCSNLRGRRLQIILCKAGNLLPVYFCGCHGDEECDHAGIHCCRGQRCRKELSRNSWMWRPLTFDRREEGSLKLEGRFWAGKSM